MQLQNAGEPYHEPRKNVIKDCQAIFKTLQFSPWYVFRRTLYIGLQCESKK